MFVQTTDDDVQARPETIQILRLDVSLPTQVDSGARYGSPSGLQFASDLDDGFTGHTG
jgi:hypothetical protein